MTVGADKTYRHGRRVRVSALRSFNVTTNVATSRRSAIDGGILRHPGYYRAGDRCLGALGFQRSRSGRQPSQSSGCPSCSRWANELDAQAQGPCTDVVSASSSLSALQARRTVFAMN